MSVNVSFQVDFLIILSEENVFTGRANAIYIAIFLLFYQNKNQVKVTVCLEIKVNLNCDLLVPAIVQSGLSSVNGQVNTVVVKY